MRARSSAPRYVLKPPTETPSGRRRGGSRPEIELGAVALALSLVCSCPTFVPSRVVPPLEQLRTGFLTYTPLREAPGLGAYNAQYVTEIHADADALFAAIDTDGSGTIDKEELRNHLKTVRALPLHAATMPQIYRAAPVCLPSARVTQFYDYSFKAISNIFKMLDVNSDGAVERAELREAFVKYSALRCALGEGPTFK